VDGWDGSYSFKVLSLVFVFLFLLVFLSSFFNLFKVYNVILLVCWLGRFMAYISQMKT